jgi:hypothetical protein
MALDYYLIIQNTNNEIEPIQVMESLRQAFSLQKNKISGFLIGVGMTVNVFKEDDDDDSLFDNSSYPDICVSFRIDKFEHSETGMNTMLKMVIWLMSYLKNNIIFLLDEQPIFKRLSSQLSLNNEADFWSPSILAVPNQSYQAASMATNVG